MATFYGTGYSANRLDGPKFAHFLRSFAPALKQALAAREVDGIIVTGTSGLSVGYGMHALGFDIPTVIVRKSDSHDTAVSCLGPQVTAKRLLFVDDTVCSGTTRERVVQRLDERYDAGTVSVVGTLVYGALLPDIVLGKSQDILINPKDSESPALYWTCGWAS